LLLLATGLALCSKTDRQASLRSDVFCLRHCSTLAGSGKKLLQRRKASGVQAVLCSGVPRLSWAEAVVAQSIIASTAIQGRLVFEIMLVTPLIDLGSGLRQKPGFRQPAGLTKS
jgi:hypothetical protein